MGVTMKKQEQEQIPVEQQTLHQPVVQADETQVLVDEFVKCSAELEPYKEMIKSIEKNKKGLQLIAVQLDPDGIGPVTIQGTEGRSVVFKAPGSSRKIKDMNGLIGALKSKISYEDLMGMISISLTELDKVLSPLESAPFIDSEQGSRTLQGYTKGDEA